MAAYMGIPIWAWMMAVAVIAAIIVFAVYAFRVKKRLAGFSEDFAKAIDEFHSLCNPGRPMSDAEWETYAASHTADFEHAQEATDSKFVALVVKDLANAHELVNIQENHQALMADAKTKNDYIVDVNYYITPAIQSQRSLFDGKHYLAKSEADAFVAHQKPLTDSVQYCIDNHIKEYLTQPQEAVQFNQFIKQIEQHRTTHNKAFVKAELQRCSEFFDNVLAYPLDPQQRTAIVNGEDNCLVVSSAGSGKTSTIQGKVRYLIDMCHIDPDDILLITYTRKAAGELRERIGYSGLTSSTFHGLAYNIISQVDKAPTIAETDFALNLFYEKIKEHKFIEAITYYLVNLLSRIKDPDKYVSEREYLADRRKYGTQAYFPDMDGKIIFTRSEEERKICHFLSTHSVNFRYEERYEFDTATTQFRQYKPDFTIYYQVNGAWRKLYLEHYAIGKSGGVPKWFGQGKGETWAQADKKYKEGIMWKRKTHRENGTALIETTSAMFSDGSWQQQLTAQLSAYGVPIVEKPAEQVYQEIVQRDKHKEKVVLELVMSFINLLKANCKTIEQVADTARKVNDGRNLFIIENMVKPFYEAYQAALAKRGEMDFTDAILQATDMCNSGQYLLKYKYIIVDEFQDISFDRYRFLMSLRSQTPLGKIFAVGDDWQSIYRFSGSDMGLFSDFAKYFGFTTLCKIESTYRFAQPAIGISSAFIQKNKSQVKKNVKSPKKDMTTTVMFEGYSEDNDLAETVANKIRAIPIDKSVYILSRYAFDFTIFRNAGYGYREVDRNIDVTIDNRKVRCLTVHQAKGLEADYVFLLKCDSDIYGFPSMISDDPVLEYLLSQQEESVEFAEERRVFYVAITRAKINTTIFYRRSRPSVFVDEIIDDMEQDGFKKCPNCGYGHMKILKQGWAKTGKYFVSLGCTNAGGGCTFFHTVFYDRQPPQETVNKLILTK
ncbi:MAG: UvrD-helicase domain-containing protein [Muribaculaceae bacterium]|nr:UvrD-helicase domain-containing protein [Muribaculaceae bacterium]